MQYKLKSIVPWGRNLAEYRAMFNLSQKDLNSKILGCGDGPSSFNAELKQMGGDVASIDPLYAFTKEQFSMRIDEVVKEVMMMVRKNESTFVWKNIADPNELETIRMAAMREFLKDYENGLQEGRYIDEMLPSLSFTKKEFDLALSSHFLFLYSEHLDFEFHLKAVEEMLRVANEIRIFPLMTLHNEYSSHLNGIIKAVEKRGYVTQIVKTEYEFQKGGNEMLVIKDMRRFLEETEIIDYSNKEVHSQAMSLAKRCKTDTQIAKRCFEYVRDNINHSGDYKDTITTYKASDVLKYKTGWCYAKSHLLAGLLRANGIPTGFCYQRLSCSEYKKEIYCLHGLNSIYLKKFGWYRVDVRGNKKGVNAQFNPPYEQLAFELQEHEFDLPEILSKPLEEVVYALKKYTCYAEMVENFPDVEGLFHPKSQDNFQKNLIIL